MDWPLQAKVAQETTKNATFIRKAFKESIDTDAIVKAWDESHPDKNSMTNSMARDWVLAHARPVKKPLEVALSRLYADGYTLGDKIAKSRLLAMVVKSVDVAPIDWSIWTPGMESAAALVNPTGGLTELLRTRKIQITDDILRTKLDRIGTVLGDSLQRGLSATETAKNINTVINDPQHALVIARTEMARSMSVASRDTYEKNNVEQVEWLVAEGCEDCQENADASPIGIDETFPTGDSEPPAHPNCMCAIAPYFDDSNLPAIDETAPEVGNQEVEAVDTGSSIEPVYEEVSPSDTMRADELARFQNYDYALNELLGIQRDDYGLWIKDELTDAGRALSGYKATEYEPINRILRNDIQASRYMELVDKSVPLLDKIIETAPPLPTPLTTYRGLVSKDAFNFLVDLKPETIFEDKGYSSTSIYRDFAHDWVGVADSSLAESKKYLIEILNPAGTKGVMIDGLKSNSASIEAEWLLPRNTKFEVVSNDTINHTLRVRVIND